jgi:hypothetical protein
MSLRFDNRQKFDIKVGLGKYGQIFLSTSKEKKANRRKHEILQLTVLKS